MVKFPYPTSSLKCAMSVAALPRGMLGARSRLRPLPLSLVGWCASCNNNNNNVSYLYRLICSVNKNYCYQSKTCIYIKDLDNS